MTRKTEAHCSASRGRFVRFVVLGLLALVALSTAVFAVTVVWTRTVNGSANGTDNGRDVVMAPNGDLYVVGDIEVTNQSSNIWIRKYDSAGNKLWTRNVDGPDSGYDGAAGAAVDGNGNLYVVGYVTVTNQSYNIWIRKYSSSGIKRWTRTVNGAANDYDAAKGAAVDANGNLYVVGYVTVAGGNRNIWIRKYSSSGAKLWTRVVDGPGGGYDIAYGAAVDSNGKLYVVGEVGGVGGGLWIRKYSSSGAKLWNRIVDGPNGDACAYGAAVDSNGNLFVVGGAVVDTWPDIWIRKYSSSGTKLWTRMPAQSAYDASAKDAVVDANGAVYVIADKYTESGSGPPNVAWIRKYSPAGVTRWTTTYAGPNNYARGYGIAMNATGRIYATGSVSKTGQGYNIWVRKYRE